MNPNDFTIQLSKVPNWKANNYKKLINELDSILGAPLGDITLSDLMLPEFQHHGIYILQEGNRYKMNVTGNKSYNDYWYVGKAASRSFTERFGSHLSSNMAGWQNGIFKRIVLILSSCNTLKDFSNLKPKVQQNHLDRAVPVFLDLRLKYVAFDNYKNAGTRKGAIATAEKNLINQLKPYLNYPTRFAMYHGTKVIV